ncbi:MAG: pilus assembly protein PilM, partial [Planctomycetota bacterium]
AKAEHLKQNATKAPDPRAVFQALRPVFNDYVAEIQRSIGYFSSVNRDAKITRALGVGNGFKLAGLQKFLQQNLQFPVERVDQFKSAVGDEALNDATFRDNVAGFAVPYGVALQAAGLTRITTSLVPPEIIQERKIRKKKPWAALAAGLLLAGVSGTALGYGHYAESVSMNRWGGTIDIVGQYTQERSGYEQQYQEQLTKMNEKEKVAEELTAPASGRGYWPELYRAISASTPGDPTAQTDKPITEREEVRIQSITTTKEDDLATWYEGLPGLTKEVMIEMAEAEAAAREKARLDAIRAQWAKDKAEAIANEQEPPPMPAELDPNAVTPPAEGGTGGEGEEESALVEPSGPGYVVTLRGVHYHDGSSPEDRDAGYLRRTILKNLREWTIDTPLGEIPVAKIGISHPALLPIEARKFKYDPNGKLELGASRRPRGGFGGFDGGRGEFGEEDSFNPDSGSFFPRGRGELDPDRLGGPGGYGPATGPTIDLDDLDQESEEPEFELINEYPFEIQFIWRKMPPAERSEEPVPPSFEDSAGQP